MSGIRFYFRIFRCFLRNAIIRELTFRGNFLIQLITRAFWFSAQIILFDLIYTKVPEINGWSRDQYYIFMATGMLINSFVEAFFMPNCANFSEQIRTGKLDFALTKPVDTQFLVSLERINVAMISQLFLASGLLLRSLWNLQLMPTPVQMLLYLLYCSVGVIFFYALMISTASLSVWFGRNQGLYDFWFYITVFARYPRSIYDGRDPDRIEGGELLQGAFSFVIPILLVVTVPARILAGTLQEAQWAVIVVIASLLSLAASRRIFRFSLNNYRSASS